MASFKTRVRKLRRRLPSGRDLLMLAIGGVLVFGGMRMVAADRESQPLTPLAAGLSGVTIPWLPPTVQRWNGTITEMGRKYNIDPDLLAIIMTVESGGSPAAKSEAGAVGLMQVTPPTANDIALRHVKQPVAQFNLEDPKTSIEFGAAYLAYLRDQFGAPAQGPAWNDTVELISAGYNGGPGAAAALDKGEGLHDIQTVSYLRDVFNMWRERRSADSPTYDRWLERGGSHLVDRARSSP